MLRWLRVLSIPVLCAAAIPLTLGQSAPSPDAPPVSTVPTDNSATEETPKETLKVTSNLVSEYFTVRDKTVSYTHLDVYKRQRPGCR